MPIQIISGNCTAKGYRNSPSMQASLVPTATDRKEREVAHTAIMTHSILLIAQPDKSVTRQIEEGISFHKKRYRNVGSYLAYFQAYSNTYAPLDTLKKLYEEALDHPEVIGIIVGTRPDCIDGRKAGLFQRAFGKILRSR